MSFTRLIDQFSKKCVIALKDNLTAICSLIKNKLYVSHMNQNVYLEFGD